MKKIIALLLTFVISTSFFVSCGDGSLDTDASKTTDPNNDAAPVTDLWDGSLASGFASGNGTEKDPYKIQTAEELAFLAKSVNEGTSYSGKYLILTNDIDLNNLEWTPIGNGKYAFEGNFDGNNHTIKNVTISQGVHYTYEYPTGKKSSYCDMGIFATIQDASIQNMVIDGATIKISDPNSVYAYHAGVLCGTIRTYQNISVISNIDIKGSTIISDFSTGQRPQKLMIGSAAGYVYAYNDTTTTISLIETDSSISVVNGYGSDNYMGTILGSSNILDSTFTLEDCVAYQTLAVNPYQYYYTFTDDFCGAIGNAQASAKPFIVKNIFSKLTINKPALEGNNNYPAAIASYAILGEAYYYALKDDPNAVGYKFENVFGFVEQVDEVTGEKQVLTELYKLPEGPTFTQVNCQGCEAIPENHGFDTNVWNLDDLSAPKLK